ncbi:MAG: hypothetical protein AAFQ09_12975 [Pseudomonadota bacterium]
MRLFALLALCIPLTGCNYAYADGHGSKPWPTEVSVGQTQATLTDENGMTLYVTKEDGDGVSKCYDSCAEIWPPYLAGNKDVAGLTRIERRDGTLQWAKDGAPLYFWIGDTAPGDMTGNGVRGVWSVAQ